jgi:hypothetical protein
MKKIAVLDRKLLLLFDALFELCNNGGTNTPVVGVRIGVQLERRLRQRR